MFSGERLYGLLNLRALYQLLSMVVIASCCFAASGADALNKVDGIMRRSTTSNFTSNQQLDSLKLSHSWVFLTGQ